MGNCNGIFSKCTGGEEVDRIDKTDVKKAVEKNKKMKDDNKVGGAFDTSKYSNNREKRPEQVLPNGAKYTGEWIGEKRDGQGIQIWVDNSKYEGQW